MTPDPTSYGKTLLHTSPTTSSGHGRKLVAQVVQPRLMMRQAEEVFYMHKDG